MEFFSWLNNGSYLLTIRDLKQGPMLSSHLPEVNREWIRYLEKMETTRNTSLLQEMLLPLNRFQWGGGGGGGESHKMDIKH